MIVRAIIGFMTCVALGLAGPAVGQDRTNDAPAAKAPAPATDGFAGKTVRDRSDGMRLIKERGNNVPKVGQMAPDFTLKVAGGKAPDGKEVIQLSSFRGKKPVVVIFGSVT